MMKLYHFSLYDESYEERLAICLVEKIKPDTPNIKNKKDQDAYELKLEKVPKDCEAYIECDKIAHQCAMKLFKGDE